ncbi:MAG: FAD-dependent oxidoreductase [Actinomycetota bacterium]|nr:FAD-dependent oxidoreductase [Actinomycetota bacterium]
MRIAIVGAGISGLVVAHLLHREHEIVVYEAGNYAGGHTNTIRVDTAEQTHHVDTGFIVFNDRNYPNFERLLERLGVASQPSTMTFSVSDGRGDFEYSGASPNGLFAKRSHLLTPWFHRMVAEMARFNRSARQLLCLPRGEGPSLGGWLEEQRFSQPFVERLIVPQASAVWSADPHQMWSFPARFMVEFFDNHGMLGFTDRPHWRTISGGSARYVEALTAPWRDRLRLRTPVHAIERAADHVRLTAAGAEPERFDHVVVATHSDQALGLLHDRTDAEDELLRAIPYQQNEAVLHTDVSLLPRRRRAWASWNYHLQENPTGKTTVTYDMNRLQSLHAAEQFCVTLNRTEEIAPETVIRRIAYAHPVFTQAGTTAQARLSEINGGRHTHFCGAYWGWGFHEDGVVSALRVGERFGARL